MAKINTKILRVETSVAKPVELQIFRGEQVDLELHFVAYGSPINLERPETAGTGFYWQTEDMGDRWWYEEGISHFPFDEDKREQGIVDFVWDSALDTGAAKYRWFVNVNRDDPADSSYRAFGTIEMLGSPANASITPLPVPPIPIDCSDYTWLNAPWIEDTSGSVKANNIGFDSYDVPIDNDDSNGTVGERLDNLDEGKLPAQFDDSTESWEVPNIVCNGDAYIDVLTSDTVRAISLGPQDTNLDPLDVPGAAYSGDAVARTSDLSTKLDAEDGEAEGLKVVGPTDGRWFYIGDAGFDDDGLYANDGSNDRTKWDIAHGKGDTTFAIRADLAPAYDDEEEHTYEVNQLVTHGHYNNVYRCKVAHTSDEWIAANWELVTIADVLDLKLDKTDVPDVPVLSVNGQTGAVVLSAANVSALPATLVTGTNATYKLPRNASIVPDNLLDIYASNVIVPSIRSAENSYALLVPNGQGSEDWIARRSDLPAPQVNSDWNATSGVAEILNKPNIIPVTIDAQHGVYKTTTAVEQLAVANSDQSKFAYLFAPQGASDTRTAYIGTNGTVQAAKLQTSTGISPNPLTIPAGADANDAVARTSDLPPFETWTFELNDSTTVTKKVCIYN